MTLDLGPGAPFGGPRAGPSGPRRLAALAALAAFCGLGVLTWLRVGAVAARHPMVGLGLPEIELASAAPCVSGAGDARSRFAFEPPGALIYISNSCPHCRAQLRVWSGLLADRGGAPPWVVVAPGESFDSTVIPARLRRRVALDHDARIARVLDARRVPLTVYVDRHRRVAARAEGRQSGAEIARLLSAIGAGPTPSRTGDCP
ncbi:hypothetical protein WI460_11360 [Gemmatimonadota bacterium Y43]|uniref:TlpA family protein disulfide reductase n=1 Tax=Gaopeijia maritima TaxID=3119007 RepID=UPI0032871166